ncbi:MAG: hypothetical protein MUF54_12180, partial [Polyangiaceae bacterium]|nr:hypothetical protein [Polyangiaceae bacterium]
VRFVPFIGLMGYTIAIRHWGAILRTGTKPLLSENRGGLELIAFIFLLASTVAYGNPRARGFTERIGWGRDWTICHEEVEFMKRSGLSGVIFNEYHDGAPIIHSLYPQLKPVMDSRIDIYGEQLWTEYKNSFSVSAAFPLYLEKHNVSYALLQKDESAWRVSYLSDRPSIAKVLLRTKSRVLFQVFGCSAQLP